MIKLKSLLKESWSAVELDGQSKELLQKTLGDKIPEGWEVIAHHMTINFKEPVSDELVGQKVTLNVTSLGISDKALAVKVSSDKVKSTNTTPHITVAVDRVNGGKPKDSNDITNWQSIEPLKLTGTVKNYDK